MSRHAAQFAVRLARSPDEVAAAQALRFRVFTRELGAAGPLTDYARGLERDRFDRHCDHVLLLDALRGDAVVGTARLLSQDGAARAGGFATEAEFDIAPLRDSGLRLLEIGRACLCPSARGGLGLRALWAGVAAVAARQGAGLALGLASFQGTDPARVAGALALLQRDHLAPPHLRPRSLRPLAPGPVAADRCAAHQAVPPLLRAYLGLGAKVGEGAFMDEAFNCIDLCVVLDLSQATPLGRAVATGGVA